MSLVLMFPLQAKSKERPRFDWGNGHAYTAEATSSFAQNVAWLARAQMSKGGLRPITREVSPRIEVQMFFCMPKRGRTDFDNLAKAICDALNGLAWTDDAQIDAARIVICYSEKPLIIVEVKPMPGGQWKATKGRAPHIPEWASDPFKMAKVLPW